jgi:hypothetical protein
MKLHSHLSLEDQLSRIRFFSTFPRLCVSRCDVNFFGKVPHSTSACDSTLVVRAETFFSDRFLRAR